MNKFFTLTLLFLQFSFSTYSQKIGVVLSGGGAAGAAHVGVLKALEENKIPIDYIVGTSVGALVGGFYASGYSPDEIKDILLSEEFRTVVTGIADMKREYFFSRDHDDATILNFNFSLDSVFTMNLPTNLISSTPIDFKLMKEFSGPDAASEGNFDNLMIPFRCLAANITKREETIFREGNLATAIRASMTYPFYLSPINIEGNMMFDGGIYNNFPVDVLCQDFDTDYIIASNVADEKENPHEDDLVSQLKGLLMQPTSFEINCSKGIIINADVDDISTFDFYQSHSAFEVGYASALNSIDSIKSEIQRRRSIKEVTEMREQFNRKKPELLFDSIQFQGLYKRPAKYFRQSLKADSGYVSSNNLEDAFFNLNSNKKVKSIYPTATFNQAKGAYNLNLKVKNRKKFNAAFGGVIASQPFSSGFFEAGYQSLKNTGFEASGNIYFGNFYNSAEGRVRWDIPFDIPFYLESRFTVNRFDYFSDGSFLIEENNPPFIIASERYWEMNLGLSVLGKGKLTLGSSMFWQEDEYHQTDDFLRTDTADFTEFNGFSNYVKFQMNSLNRKQYATKGQKVDLTFRHTFGEETTIPGSRTNLAPIINRDRDWVDIRFSIDKYFLKQRAFHFGTYLEVNYSELPSFQNFTATLLRSNAFTPIAESKTRFIENLRARRYAGGGIKMIYSFRDFIDIRTEAYIFQPYKDFIRNNDGSTGFGEEFNSQLFIGTLTTVYHSRVGPLALSLNFFNDQSPNLSFLVHFGYVIFNKRAFK